MKTVARRPLQPGAADAGREEAVVVRINLEQARKRAKELVREGRAPTLAAAQRVVAQELGYDSWPRLVHDVGTRLTPARIVELAADRGEQALELLAEAPELRDDPWVAVSLGDASRIADPVTPGGPLACPPLFYVARTRIAGDTVTAARTLLAGGADPNGRGHEGWTNLSVACSRGDAPLVALLLEAGAEPNDEDSLYHSVETPAIACTQLLLAHGAVVAGTNALHHALDYERLEPVRLLLDAGGDPNEHAAWPALHHAVSRDRSSPFLRLLVERGADPAARDEGGRTAYQHAVRRGRDDLAATLRDLGSPTDVEPGDRVLHAIAAGGDVTTADLDADAPHVLITLAMHDRATLGRVIDAMGPDFSARWGGGPRGTLLHQASWLGRPDLVELLLERGADVEARVETDYATPLGWAAVGSRYSPDHPDDTFSSPDADYVGVATRLVRAGARIEPMFAEMASGPLAAWLDERAGPR
jgi:ankyrin repeat protein